MSFLLTDGRGVAFDDDDDDDAVVAATTTMASTSTSTSTTTATDRAPTRRSRHHARTYTPHTESLVGLFARRVSDYGSFVPLPRAGTAVDVVDVEVHGGGDLNCMEVNGLLDYSHIDDGDDDGGEDEDEEDSGNERTRSSWGFTRTSSRGGGQKIPPPSSHPSLDKVLARLIPALLGSFLFPLYQLVFCFAEASAITRPSRLSSGLRSSLLSPMALTACVGSLFSGPMLIAVLGGSRDYPALYPCLDMFMAPFLAQIAVDVDEALVRMRPPRGGGGGGGRCRIRRRRRRGLPRHVRGAERPRDAFGRPPVRARRPRTSREPRGLPPLPGPLRLLLIGGVEHMALGLQGRRRHDRGQGPRGRHDRREAGTARPERVSR